jgi:hypothetical protein
MFAGVVERQPGAGDRCTTRAAVGLQDVAVERDLAFAERLEVGHRAQRATDQALDFLRAATLLALGRLASGTRVRRARQHAVFGGDPALSAAAQKGGVRTSSTLAVHSTRVSPISISTEPSAWRVKARAIVPGAVVRAGGGWGACGFLFGILLDGRADLFDGEFDLLFAEVGLAARVAPELVESFW